MGCSDAILLILCAIVFCFFVPASQAAESTISEGQSIKDGQTLVSPNQVFALGFFSFPSKPRKRYAGIWYHGISVQTVVWVANRERPITDSSGVITIGSFGDIQIRSGDAAVWSTNTSMPSLWSSSFAALEDSGNLVHRASDLTNNSMVIWESFRHPSDTYLPGMTLELDLWTGENQVLTSRTSADDPSLGRFTLGLDPSGSAQIVMWAGGRKRWRSGQWNGQIFTGITTMKPLNLFGFKLTIDREKGKMYLKYSSVDPLTRIRFVMRWDAVVEQLQWSEANQSWTQTWSHSTSPCELYGLCGAFEICQEDDSSSSSSCSCLKGFEETPQGGCRRRRELSCGSGRNGTSGSVVGEGESDGFVRVGGMKLPDLSSWVAVSGGRSDCEQRCLENCSCRAYAFVGGIGCMIWVADLIDLRTLVGGGNDLYLRLAGSELAEDKISNKIIIIIVVHGTIFLSIFAYVLWRWRAKEKGCWKKREKTNSHQHSSKELFAGFSRQDEFFVDEHGEIPELTYFNITCISYATENFLEINKLGEGGFGPVYKGKLPGGQEIAVKRLSSCSGQGLEEFKNEVIMIAKLQHRNLVRLMGCCIQRDERMLVYEYMPNKSLDLFLFDPSKKQLLGWEKRFSIMEGIARGLLYLHRDSRLRIIHRDLKAGNILLDGEMSPKISDFGMARIFSGNQNHANTERVVGTYGYMAPEYAMEGLFSVKSDVYSFGVLVLEIVCGRKNGSTFQHGDGTLKLVGHAWKLWNEDKGTELVDPSLGSSYSVCEALQCIHLGLLCVQDHAASRPDMSSVVLMLEGDTRTHQYPKPPTFSVVHSREMEPFHSSERYLSNDATMTVLIGR